MRTTRHDTERGQALVLVTLSLTAMLGILALAVDIGWNYSVKEAAQTAADAGAMAAATEALSKIGSGNAVCGVNGVACQPTALTCTSATGNLLTGCQYASKNGFASGGKQGRQLVTVAANAGTTPPTAAGVNDVFYWVTVTVREMVPGMFSAIYRPSSIVSARATAIITNGVQGGTLYLLNRQNDTFPAGTGVNVDMGGNTTITAPGGIFMASNKDPSARIQGTPNVTAPFTYIRGAGSVSSGGSATWVAAPQNGLPDSSYFKDPMAGKGQPPPLPAAGLNGIPVPGGDLSSLPQPLPSGQYYATDKRTGNATGGQLTVSGNVTFQDGTFGNYVLYGGLSVSGDARFYPGRYVLAGARSGTPILAISNQGNMHDNSAAGQQNSDAGEIFIFTDANYPGLGGRRPAAVNGIASALVLNSVELQSGNRQILTLHGLNRDAAPSDLKDFAPFAFWQDQRNSRVLHKSDGNIDTTSCGGMHDLDNPCTNAAMANSTTPRLKLQAHPNTSIYGGIYQPRGAWMDLQGNGSITSPLMVVTGAMTLGGGCDVGLLQNRDQLRRKVVALVE